MSLVKTIKTDHKLYPWTLNSLFPFVLEANFINKLLSTFLGVETFGLAPHMILKFDHNI